MTITQKKIACFAITGIIQSLLIYSLIHYVPYSPFMQFSYVLTGLSGAILLLSYDNKKIVRCIITSVVTAIYIACITTYQNNDNFATSFLAIISSYTAICLHKVYHQRHSTALSYRHYFDAVWDIFCTIILSSFFIVAIWSMLALWAGLFYLTNVDFFVHLFFDDHFFWTSLPIIFSAGVYIIQARETTIQQLKQLLLTFCQILLPFITVISLLYLFINSFHKIMPPHTIQINEDYITIIMLILAAVGITLINTVYQYGQALKKITPWKRITIFLLSITLSYYLLSAVFGWHSISTPHRVVTNEFFSWTATSNVASQYIAYIMLAIYSIMYTITALRPPQKSFNIIKIIHPILAWVLMLSTLAIQNPLVIQDSTTMPRTIVIPHRNPPIKTKRPSLKKAHLAWINHTTRKKQPIVLLGYSYQAKLYGCRSEYANGLHPGQLKNNQCVISYAGKAIVVKRYQLLVGKGQVHWEQYNRVTIAAGHEANGQLLALCRTIYHNEIHIGKEVSGACNISIGGEEIQSQPYQTASAVFPHQT